MQKTPHFFKFYSRMGLKNPPIYTKALNIGVEEAPDAILDDMFLASFPTATVDAFAFADPQTIPDKDFMGEVAVESFEAISIIKNTLSSDETQVVVGGDHSVAFASINAVLERVKSVDLGYVQIDSHTDMNRYDESISKNWHGMYLRPLLDGYDVPLINALVSQKLTHKNVTFIGNLDADPAEWKFFQDNNLANITVEQARKKSGLDSLLVRLSQLKHLHISIDIDGFDGSIAPATGLPAKEGLLFEDVKPLFDFAKSFPSISIDLVEVNPKKEGAQQTIKLAQDILRALV
ncbi:arginase family protein [Candidatus Microgenomates bacterium]|nr:arginase family protein [Candidatus Microgenomates bacterium]